MDSADRIGLGGLVPGWRMSGAGIGQVVPLVARMTIATRGLSYPQTRVQARRIRRSEPLTASRLRYLEGAGEEEFARWVKARAHVYGWMGWHLRDSEGVIESIHTLRLDGFCDGLGVPDWLFWHEEFGQHFLAELKGASGALGRHQKREIASMQRGGIACFVWYPRDAWVAERIFAYGLEAAA